MLSAVVDRMAVGDGLKDGELVAVVNMGAVEMTDAVFVAPTVVPVKRKGHRDINRKFTFSKADLGDAVPFSILVEIRRTVSPVKDKLVLVRGITVFTVKVVGVVIVGLLTRLAVLAT